MENKEENIVAPEEQKDDIKAPVVDQTKVKLAADALESFKKEIKSKLYALPGDDSLVSEIKGFIENEAQWKAMEALGVEELTKRFNDLGEIKNGVFYLNGLEVEALHYFLSKVEGKGRESSAKYLRMVRSVNEGLKMRQADTRQQIKLEHELAAAEQGIDLTAPVEKKEEEE